MSGDLFESKPGSAAAALERSAQKVRQAKAVAEALGASTDAIVAQACPERPGTARRIHRLWEGPQGSGPAAYRVNWHEDGADCPWGSEHRVVASSFVTVSAAGQVACQAEPPGQV